MKTLTLTTTSFYFNLLQIALVLILLVMVLFKWVTVYDQTSTVISSHTTNLMDKLIVQSSAQATQLLRQQQNTQLNQLLMDLYHDPHIEQAMVLDKKGTVIAMSPNALTAHQRYLLNKYPPDAYTPDHNNTIQSKQPTVTMVREMRDQGQLLGYFSINYYHRLLVNDQQPDLQFIMEQIHVIVLFSILMGFLLARGLSRFSRNTFRIH